MLSSPRRSIIAVFMVVSVIIGGEERAVAWEADVHYGLTYWLARKAGFSPEEAQFIAAGDLSSDQGWYRPAPWAVALHVIVTGDLEASKAVQESHSLPMQTCLHLLISELSNQTAALLGTWLSKKRILSILPSRSAWS